MTTLTHQTMIQDEKQGAIINPKVFVMWLIIVASIMLFAGFTSAYIVRRGEGNWELFQLPVMFRYTLFIALAGSASMIWASFSARKNNDSMVQMALWASLLLGAAFCYGQFEGWKELVSNSVYLVGNPSGSFVYVISGMHLLHVILGIVFIMVLLVLSYTGKLAYQNYLYLKLGATFWHFVGILWIYLYTFLSLYR